MNENHHIIYLHHHEIDKEKWNACVDQSMNGLIYHYSHYLDAMSPKWHALVMNDYEAIMPLTWKKKWSIHYLYQPFLIAQSGVVSRKISKAIVQDFLNAIPSKFNFWEINLNYRNIYQLEKYHLHLRKNYVLQLNQPYQNLYDDYRQNIKRNIKKAIQYGCTVTHDNDVKEVVALAIQFTPKADDYLKEFQQFVVLYKNLYERKQAITYGVHSSKGELISSCAFFFSNKRAYYILVGNHPNGRTLGASHLLIDTFIKDHAEQDLVLDFEGSDIPNLAFFYESFGAKEENYSAIKMNRLPWYLKFFKK